MGQFYGIEINDFAVTVARTALWISEDQMMKETMNIIHQTMDILPLKSYANIVEGNALTMDWNNLVDKNELDYIMGNPPFVGGMMMDREQKEQIKSIFGNISGVGEIDYVTAWYKKSAEMMNENPNIVTALVSTNSISQGMQPAIYWKYLRDKYDVDIVFAYSTFKWESEAVMKAAVHVVIIGFTNINNEKKRDKFLYTSDTARKVSYINGYLIEAGDIYIESRNKPICDVKEMNFGNMPRDGGAFILTEEEKDWLIKNEPITKEWIHLYLGAREFINSKKRYCLWLEGVEPNLLRNSASVMKRVESVRDMRLSSKAKATQKMAETPTLFAQRTQKIGKPFIMVPRVSSENRKYVPIGFLPGDIIASDAALIITDSDIYDFGILTSNVHMSWMRAVAGRLEMRYRYSKNIVYNNFPWPVLDDYHKRRIEKSAQMILDSRAIYPSSSLADLYDELTMPPELIKAHQENDARVMKAYGFDWENMSESDCVAELMKMYEKLIGK